MASCKEHVWVRKELACDRKDVREVEACDHHRSEILGEEGHNAMAFYEDRAPGKANPNGLGEPHACISLVMT